MSFDIQTIISVISGLFGAGGVFFGIRERKLRNKEKEINNFNLIQEIYKDMLIDIQNHVKTMKNETIKKL